MRIVCPSCAAAYEVPANRLAQRRTVRCARCGGEWVAVRDIAETPSPAPPGVADARPSDTQPMTEPPASLPAVTAMDRLVASSHVQRRSGALIAAWVLTFGALGGGAAAVFFWRESVVHAWPPSARILGLQARTAGDVSPSGRGAERD